MTGHECRIFEIEAVEGVAIVRLVLDLDAVKLISTVMLGVLIRLKAVGGRLAICRLDPPIREAIRITRLDRIPAIYRDEHAVLATS